MAILYRTAKFNFCQYFWLYGIFKLHLYMYYELHTWQSQRCWSRLQRASFMSSSEVTSADSRPRLHLPTAAFTHKVKVHAS